MELELALGALLLFTGATIFLFAELFIPAHGLLAIICGLLAIGGVALCFAIGTRTGFVAAIATMIAGPLLLALAVRIYPKSPVGKRVLLRGPSGHAIDRVARESLDLAKFLGQRGTATTILRPAGICDFNGRRIDCMSESQAINRGSTVEVIRVDGTHVYVRAVEPEPTGAG